MQSTVSGTFDDTPVMKTSSVIAGVIRRRIASTTCALALGAMLAVAVPHGVLAQSAPLPPARVMRLIVPYAAGGPIDVTARMMAESVKNSLGTVIIENRPGAGGNIGADATAKAAPDGLTIGISAVATHAINPLHEGTPSLLTSILGGGSRMQKTGEHRAAGRGLEATLELVADYLYLLAHHSWPNEIDTALRTGLSSASGKPWREAADLLWNHANATAKFSHRVRLHI